MSLLSEEEISAIAGAKETGSVMGFARAIEAAILAKLASAELLPVQDLSDEEKQFIHYNPNTDDLVDFIQGHAADYGRQAHAQGFAAGAAAQLAEPIYQYRMANGQWLDQAKHSYDYNRNHAPNAVVRIVYAAPKALAPEPLTQLSSYTVDLDKVRRDEKDRSHGIGGTP